MLCQYIKNLLSNKGNFHPAKECTVLTGQYEACSDCSRLVLQKGKINRIEVAFDKNGEHPLIKELDDFVKATRKKADQENRLADLLQVLLEFVNEPLEMLEKDLKYLRNDVWELKAGTLRILFGEAICHSDRTALPNGRQLVFPSRVRQSALSSTCGRATNAFKKRGDNTPRERIDQAIGILREDRSK